MTRIRQSPPRLPGICPCCGQTESFNGQACQACGARQVSEPLARPDVLLPGLSRMILSLTTALTAVGIYLMVWLFGNDMKALRVLMVWVFGDQLKFTRELLRYDPKLPYYNIFSYDAWRLAFYLSVVVIPLALLSVWLARRAQRLIRERPAQYGGRRMTNATLAFATTLALIFTTVVITSLPRALEDRQARQAAATRATLYQLGHRLREYNEAYGRYPRDLAELEQFSRATLPQTDYWEKPIIYSPAAFIASRGTAPGFSDYKLISAGPDGLSGTADDIILQDGVILSTSDNDFSPGMPVPDKPAK
jgi:hypothetical protein